jgi:chemotaxis protein CheX
VLTLLFLNPKKVEFPKLIDVDEFKITEYTSINNVDVLSFDAILMTECLKKEEFKALKERTNFKFIPFILLKKDGKNNQENEINFNFVANFPKDEATLFQILNKVKKMVENANNFNYSTIEPFKEAIPEVFSTMAYLEANLVEAYIDSNNTTYGEISASLSLTGSRRGILVITFSEKLARKMISRFIAMEADKLSKSEVYDGAGEIINIIAGNAKARINDLKDHFDLSAPFVVSGQDHNIYIQNDLPCVTMVYNVEGDYFAFKLFLMSLKSKK